ncbi:hypothetical protein H7X69_01850 [Candidatus Saccharibacteria bacterium]|nr:hypothetical protein [Candidatus Saccharibacteria bacterium]
MIHRKLHKFSHSLKDIALRNNIASRLRKRAIIRFAEKVGFVYFGSVDQHHDDHHIIRGLTVSSSHRDNHYSVGSFDGYDVSLVDRLDTIEYPTGQYKTRNWLILEIDLHSATNVPRIFLGAHTHKDSSYVKMFTAFPALQAVPLGTFEKYSEEFTTRYSLFASPSHFIDVERYFTDETTRTIAAHFWPLAIEVSEGALYIYTDNQTITTHLLETMLKNGLWLAGQLDTQAKLFDY